MEVAWDEANGRISVQRPAVYSMNETAKLFGFGYSRFRELVHEGRAPVEPIRVGRKIVFSRAKVDALLGLAGVDGLSEANPH